MSEDGIEIHFDEKSGCLELACEPDAFAAYRNVAREHLKGFPDIPLEKVIEINVVDATSFTAHRNAPKRGMGGVLFGIVVAVILALALFGAYALLAKIGG